MIDDEAQILSIRQLTLNQIQQVRSAPKPTYWIDGQRVHWEQYVDALQRTVDWCDKKLADNSPYEVATAGVTK